jgi:hypothetical protein
MAKEHSVPGCDPARKLSIHSGAARMVVPYAGGVWLEWRPVSGHARVNAFGLALGRSIWACRWVQSWTEKPKLQVEADHSDHPLFSLRKISPVSCWI